MFHSEGGGGDKNRPKIQKFWMNFWTILGGPSKNWPKSKSFETTFGRFWVVPPKSQEIQKFFYNFWTILGGGKCQFTIFNIFSIAVFWAIKQQKSKFLAYFGQKLIFQVILHGIMHILRLSCFCKLFFVKTPRLNCLN